MKELVESEQQPAETACDAAIAGVREIMSLQRYYALITVDPQHTFISSRIKQNVK